MMGLPVTMVSEKSDVDEYWLSTLPRSCTFYIMDGGKPEEHLDEIHQ
jgi:hypothetical protein